MSCAREDLLHLQTNPADTSTLSVLTFPLR
jgi:hypothetical protein